MFSTSLSGKIKSIRQCIVAIGHQHPTDPNLVGITGSGFCVSEDGKILTAAHLYNQLNEEQRKNLKAFAMVEQMTNGLERYSWIPIELINKNDKNDAAIFQLKEYKNTLLKKIDLGDSENVEVGQDVYFIGFPYAAQLINDGFGVTLIVNRGIISNIKHDGVDPARPRNWLIVDAISNPGNSGCPILDVETNKVIGLMSISFRTQSQVMKNLDIREPMHIAGAKPINLAKELLK